MKFTNLIWAKQIDPHLLLYNPSEWSLQWKRQHQNEYPSNDFYKDTIGRTQSQRAHLQAGVILGTGRLSWHLKAWTSKKAETLLVYSLTSSSIWCRRQLLCVVISTSRNQTPRLNKPLATGTGKLSIVYGWSYLENLYATVSLNPLYHLILSRHTLKSSKPENLQ